METGLIEQQQTGLRKDRLSLIEAVAQSVGTTAPSVAPFMTLPLIYAAIGNATWLVMIFTTIALLFLSRQLNVFTRRIATAGAMLVYIRESLGLKAGLVASMLFLIGYIAGTACAAAGFTNLVLTGLHENIDFTDNAFMAIAIATGAMLLAGYLAWCDVKLSSKVMLVIEAVTVSLVLVVLALYFIQRGDVIDMQQLTLQNIDTGKLFPGMVLTFFAFIGFESSSDLGMETKNPLVTIPRAIVVAIFAIAAFLIVCGYSLITVYNDPGFSIGQDMPPLYLAKQLGHSAMATIMYAGITVAFIACLLAATNATARMLYQMATDRQLPPRLGHTHPRNATPHIAVATTVLIVFGIDAIMLLAGVAPMDIFGYLGTISTFGILGTYVMITIAAPVFLKKRSELRPRDIVATILTLIFLSVPLIGCLYPVPDYPFNLLPYIFVALLVAGSIYLIKRRTA